MRSLTKLGTTLVLTFALAACGGDDGPTDPGNGPESGTFNVTVTGDVEAEFEGTAFFGEATDPDTQEEAWVLWMTTTESQAAGRAVYFVREGSRPGTGTYALLDLDGDDDLEDGGIGAVFYDYASQTIAGAFVSSGGSLQITQSSGSGMEGSFTLQASGIIVDGGEASEANVTITGEFDAEGGNVFFPGF